MIVQDKLEGSNCDHNGYLVEQLPSLTLQQMADFHKNNIATAPRVLIVIGDKKAVSLKELSRFGKVIELKKGNVYK